MKGAIIFLLGFLCVSCTSGAGSYADRYTYPTPPIALPDDDDQAPITINPFVMTAHDPFSTLATDADSASYNIFVRDVGLYGALPDPLHVRIEDFVNYFSYDYGDFAHDSEVPFKIRLHATPHPMGRETTLLRVAVQAKDPPPEVKKPANLVFLVDVSGSMGTEDKLPLVQTVLSATIDELDPTDTIAIVTYAGDTAVRLTPTPVSDAERIRREISGLSAGGSTAGASGINLAYEQAGAGFIEGGINHVILCTDGDFNVGISDTDALVDLIEEKRRSGVTLTALGFGRDNLNDGMMEAVSNAGNGMYSVIVDEEHAIEYAADRILSTIVQVAKDTKIQVEFNPTHVLAYRLLGYENRAIDDMDFRNDRIDAGEVGAGHRVTALYELVLANQSVPMPEGAPTVMDGEPVEGERDIDAEQLVMVRVRYKAPGASEEDPANEIASDLEPGEILAEAGDAGLDLQWVSAVASFAEILRASPFASEDELASIASIVEEQQARDDDRAEFAALFDAARRLLGAE